MKERWLAARPLLWGITSAWTLASAFTLRGKENVRTHQLFSTTSTRSEPMPWLLNTEKYGVFDQEDWGWVYSTVLDEACSSYKCTNVEGTIPSDLQGLFLRTGPGKFERNGRRYNHVLDGDGFVVSFRFENGKVRYTGRFVETEYFVKEEEEDKILFRNVFGTQRDGGMLANAFDLNLKNVANTNVLQWGGRVFVLWEAGRPYELDPGTLETLAAKNDGPLKNMGKSNSMRGVTIDEAGPIDTLVNFGRGFTAHPHKIDDNTLLAFKAGQNPLSEEVKMDIIEYDVSWKEKSVVKYTLASAATAPHDIAYSDDYYCLLQNAFDLDTLPFLFGLKSPTQVMQIPMDRPALLHLVPRPHAKNKKALVFEVPSYFTIHSVAKAQQIGNQVILHSNGWDLTDERYFAKGVKSIPFLGSWGGRYPDFVNGIVPPGVMYRTVVNVDTGIVESHEQPIPGLVMEFPVHDEVETNIAYCAAASTDNTSMPGTGFAMVDTKSGDVKYWWAEPKIFTGELTPVTKMNGQKGSWLLGILFDKLNERGSLTILDSERFEDGPICRVHLPHPIPYELHGSFSRLS
jgi:all-trans-8'-apo-beta-carotenal 15,15'-oxygenase